MKTAHANDKSIQQYVFDLDNCDSDLVEHINSCNLCGKIAYSYRLLSKDIKEQESPILNSNLEDLIVERITNEIKQKQRTKKHPFVGAMIIIVIGIIAIILNTLITELKNLFDANSLSTYFIICIGVFMTILLSMDIVRSFNIKMNKINIS